MILVLRCKLCCVKGVEAWRNIISILSVMLECHQYPLLHHNTYFSPAMIPNPWPKCKRGGHFFLKQDLKNVKFLPLLVMRFLLFVRPYRMTIEWQLEDSYRFTSEILESVSHILLISIKVLIKKLKAISIRKVSK